MERTVGIAKCEIEWKEGWCGVCSYGLMIYPDNSEVETNPNRAGPADNEISREDYQTPLG